MVKLKDSMNKKGFLEMEMDESTMIAAALGLFGGFVGLFVVSFGGLGLTEDVPSVGVFWKIIIFLFCTVSCFIAVKWIGSRG